MTREETMLKLLAVEPETKDGLILATGWDPRETVATIQRLMQEKRIGYGCGPRAEGIRRYHLRTAA